MKTILIAIITSAAALCGIAANTAPPRQLPEVVVASGKWDAVRLSAYVREYSTLSGYSDTITLFREKIVDFMVPAAGNRKLKGWTNPRLLASQSFYRFSDTYGTDSVSDYFRQHFSWSDWIDIPKTSVAIPGKLLENVEAADTIRGKYQPSAIWTRSEGNISLAIDVLADTANYSAVPRLAHFLKRSSDRLEFTGLKLKYDFADIGTTSLPVDLLTKIEYTIESCGRGKPLFRVFRADEPYFVSTRAEIFITDRQYISNREARRLEAHPPESDGITISPPPEAPMLDNATALLCQRVAAIDKDSLRLNLMPDKKLVGHKELKQKKPGILNTLRSMLPF